MNKIFIDKDKLYQLFIIEEKSLKEIAEIFGCNRSVIKNRCLEYGFSRSKEISVKIRNRSIKETCLQKYGVEHFAKTDEVKIKKSQTCIKKYGVKTNLLTEEFKKVYKEKMLEKYGVENPMQSNEIKERFKQKIKDKYGVDYPQQNKEIKEKSQKTCLERYGVKNIIELNSSKEKLKKVNLEKFGVENPFLSKEWREQALKKTMEKFGGVNPIHLPEIRLKALKSSLRSYITRSSYEFEIIKYIKTIYDKEIVHGDYSVLKTKEIDIYLPDIKFGIEFNGDYWHSDEKILERTGMTSEEYDNLKKSGAEEKGVELIFIWESDWNNNKNKYKELIKNKICGKAK